MTTQANDYLEQDPPLRGQNFVCLSFLDPADVIVQKDTFTMFKFLSSVCNDLDKLIDQLCERLPDYAEELRATKQSHPQLFPSNALSVKESLEFFKSLNEEQLENDFRKEHGFQTSVRGIKVRGVFDTQLEANNHCNKLRAFDEEKHNIFVAQVGCWCPWNPNPDSMETQEYVETELNTLMAEYNKNRENKNKEYTNRKNQLQDYIQKDNLDRKAANASIETEDVVVDEASQQLESAEITDPWLENKEKSID